MNSARALSMGRVDVVSRAAIIFSCPGMSRNCARPGVGVGTLGSQSSCWQWFLSSCINLMQDTLAGPACILLGKLACKLVNQHLELLALACAWTYAAES
eukprot:4140484-Pleurochrysis_carterae.AAC.1